MADDELQPVLLAYRKSRRKMWAHGIFMAVCMVIVFFARRLFGMPPQVIVPVIVAAFAVFGRDIMVFFQLRSRLAELRAQQES